MALLRQGKALALTMYLGESDQWHGTTLYVALMQYLREQGCAGATVTRAVAGYGGARLHAEGGLRWSSDAPLVLQVIDQPERLHRLLPHIEEMLNGGLITLHEVEVLKYTHARSRGLSTKLLVRQVMATAITTVGPETLMASVVDLLLAAPFRALPVVDAHHHLLGIISTGDLIAKGFLPMRRGLIRTAQDADERTADAIADTLEQARRSDLTAGEVMNSQVRTMRPENTLRDAASVMIETGLRRLPVVESQGTLVGMLTRADLLQVIVTSPVMNMHASSATQPLGRPKGVQGVPVQQQPITAYMTTDVATVEEQTPLAEVIDALLVSPLKRVVVLDREQRITGIISDVDVLKRMQAEVRPGLLPMLTNWARGVPAHIPTGALQSPMGNARTALDLMNRDVVTVSENASVQETIERMMSTKRKVLPVTTTQNRFVGVVGRSDVLRILLEEE